MKRSETPLMSMEEENLTLALNVPIEITGNGFSVTI